MWYLIEKFGKGYIGQSKDKQVYGITRKEVLKLLLL